MIMVTITTSECNYIMMMTMIMTMQKTMMIATRALVMLLSHGSSDSY
jgi:hypothetical protein